jgi:23S rRNA (pseudouridine1915-N3)-methyltransferase
MKLLVATVATRPPAWVEAAWEDYAKRMPRESPLLIQEIRPEPRTTGKSPEAMMVLEAKRIEAALAGAGATWRRVVLDEKGDALTTHQLADRLREWQAGGANVALIVGGPDGLDPTIKASAHERIRLSSLTLPHALVRVILAEALYRASSVLRGHPYHRE